MSIVTENFNNKNTEDEIDFKEVLRVIRSYRKSLASIFAIVVVITIYITLTTRPVWQATTVVMIKEGGATPVHLSLILV